MDRTCAASVEADLTSRPNPFEDTVVRSSRQSVVDAGGVHRRERRCLREMVRICGAEGRSFLLPVVGDAGSGKTHLLAMLHEEIEGLFIEIEPFSAGEDFHHHLLAGIVNWLNREKIDPPGTSGRITRLEQAGVMLLARTLIPLLANERDQHRVLNDYGLRNPEHIRGLIRADPLYVLDCLGYVHLDVLRQAAHRRSQEEGRDPEVTRAILHLLERDESHDLAFQWLSRGRLEEVELAKVGLARNLVTEDQVKVVLDELIALFPGTVVLALDRLDYTHTAFAREGTEALQERFRGMFGTLERLYANNHHLSIVVCSPETTWDFVGKHLDTALVDRFGGFADPKTGDRVTILNVDPMTDAGVAGVISARMAASVWEPLGVTPPTPTYPFTMDQIEAMNHKCGGNIRRFLKLARDVYEPVRRATTTIEDSRASDGSSQPLAPRTEERKHVAEKRLAAVMAEVLPPTEEGPAVGIVARFAGILDAKVTEFEGQPDIQALHYPFILGVYETIAQCATLGGLEIMSVDTNIVLEPDLPSVGILLHCTAEQRVLRVGIDTLFATADVEDHAGRIVQLLERRHLDHLYLFRWQETSLKDAGTTVEILTPWAQRGKLILEYVSMEQMGHLAALAEMHRTASIRDAASPWPLHQVEAFIAEQADGTVLPQALSRLRDL